MYKEQVYANKNARYRRYFFSLICFSMDKNDAPEFEQDIFRGRADLTQDLPRDVLEIDGLCRALATSTSVFRLVLNVRDTAGAVLPLLQALSHNETMQHLEIMLPFDMSDREKNDLNVAINDLLRENSTLTVLSVYGVSFLRFELVDDNIIKARSLTSIPMNYHVGALALGI